MLKTLHNIVKTNSPNATVFFNGSCEIVNDGVYYLEYQQYNTHYEIEELASGTGDYDKVCLKAKYFENFGKPIYGMTGKFHLTWGEFGGYKSDNALKYECAYSLSLGIGMSIGDQIHPSGKMDEYTYELIGKAYSFYKGLENVCLPSKSVCDFGFVFSSDNETNNGLNHLLLELKVDYTIFNEDSNIANFKCVIIPDATQLSDALLAKIKAYYKNGGKLFVSGEAIKYFSETGIAYLGKSNCDVDYILCEDIISSPCVSYLPAHITNPGTNKILSSVYKPYYNRTIEHFCSHMHSPNKLEKEDYPASIKCENLIYVAHDLFKEYEQYGQEYIKNYFNLFLSELYNDRILSCEGLQSLGRIRLRDNEVQSKLLLHILYAPPIKRGAAFVIEDFPTVKNVKVQIKTDKKIKKVYSETTNENIPFQCSEGKIYVTVPEFACYELISLEY